MQANWLTYVDAGRAATVRGWLDALGPPSIAADPAPGVMAAWMAALSGDETALADHLQALEEFQDYGPLPDGSRSRGVGDRHDPGTLRLRRPGRDAGRRAAGRRARDRRPLAVLRHREPGPGHAAYVVGDLDLAANLLEKASYNDAAPAIIRVLGLSTLSLVEAERGRSDAQR